MNNRMFKGLILLFLISAISACKKKSVEQTAVDKEQIKKEIQAKEDEFAETYNSGQMKKIGYYADDATTFAQNQPPLVGKPAIVEYLKANIDSLSKNYKISFHTDEVFPSNDANQVVEIGYYKVIDPDSHIINTGYYMTLFVKRDGKYACLRDMSTSDMLIE